MKQRKAKIDRVSIAHANGNARRYAKGYMESVDNFRGDAQKKERLEKHLCKSCFYFFKSRIGGAMMTSRACGLCDTEMNFCSTATDPLCLSCAKDNGLCKQCGGDIESKDRRNAYPFEIN
ncbi:MAG: hypothetical protein C9356_15210 [Oleiphilus sp.]|nr:MAG: hypothetical protein C9356_15210 [Oleiphilus sp.]